MDKLISKPSFEAILPWTTLSIVLINSVALICIGDGRVPFPDTWHSTASSNDGLNSLCNCLTQVHRLEWPSAKYKLPISASYQNWARPLIPPRSHHRDHPYLCQTQQWLLLCILTMSFWFFTTSVQPGLTVWLSWVCREWSALVNAAEPANHCRGPRWISDISIEVH